MRNLPERSKDRVPIYIDGPFAAVQRAWQIHPPQNALVLIVKSTVSIVPDAAVVPASDQPSPGGDQRYADDATSSLRYASDYAPFKPRADVVLVGHAYPPSSRVHTASVRLAFGRELRCALAAVGDRDWQEAVPTEPRPFKRIPLRYERAFGGPGYSHNPLGIGVVNNLAGARLPNLEQPRNMIHSPNDRPAPACFAPIPPEWPVRQAHVGSYDQQWLEQRWPYFASDFDYRYFNCAPPAQQIPYPLGDEAFALAGVHPEHQVINGRLAGYAARAYALSQPAERGELRQLPLQLDTVWIDADAMELVLVWRGFIATSAEHAPELAALFVCDGPAREPLSEARVRERLQATLTELYGPPERYLDDAPNDGDSASRAEGEKPFAAGKPRMPAAMDRSDVVALVASGASLQGADLSGCDLSGLDLRGRKLAGANLLGAFLDGVRLDGADLRRAQLSRIIGYQASFREADLSAANLADATLTEADLSAAIVEGASLAGANAGGARFEGARMAYANLSDARLVEAVFDGATLASADLSGADLSGASLLGAVLDDAQLYDAVAEKCCFDGASMRRFRADGSNLSRSSLADVQAQESSFQHADLRNTNFSRAALNDAVFSHAQLDRAVLDRAVAKGARFRRASLAGARAVHADLMECSFESADLSGADLTAANLYGANCNQATLHKLRLDGALLEGSGLAEPQPINRAHQPE